jgi:soluble lytic murein transglycosylase
LRKYRTAYPRGANLKYWQVAFPSVFKKLVNANAARFKVPPELLMALIREESAFNPRQVSRARAIGLTQLLITTARRFARKLKLRITVATLKRPEVNVPVGARYLGWLLRLFRGRKTLAVAAYNCGERRIKRWVRNQKNLQVDEFVELIPIDETRKYTKRVLGSAFAYRALARPANPSVPIAFKLPAQASKPARTAPSKVAIRR